MDVDSEVLNELNGLLNRAEGDIADTESDLSRIMGNPGFRELEVVQARLGSLGPSMEEALLLADDLDSDDSRVRALDRIEGLQKRRTQAMSSVRHVVHSRRNQLDRQAREDLLSDAKKAAVAKQGETSAGEIAVSITEVLRRTNAIVDTEVTVMKATTEVVDGQTKSLHETSAVQRDLGAKTKTGKRTVTRLRAREKLEQWALYVALIFFFGCVVFVLQRRVRNTVVVRHVVGPVGTSVLSLGESVRSFGSNLHLGTNVQAFGKRAISFIEPYINLPFDPAISSINEVDGDEDDYEEEIDITTLDDYDSMPQEVLESFEAEVAQAEEPPYDSGLGQVEEYDAGAIKDVEEAEDSGSAESPEEVETKYEHIDPSAQDLELEEAELPSTIELSEDPAFDAYGDPQSVYSSEAGDHEVLASAEDQDSAQHPKAGLGVNAEHETGSAHSHEYADPSMDMDYDMDSDEYGDYSEDYGAYEDYNPYGDYDMDYENYADDYTDPTRDYDDYQEANSETVGGADSEHDEYGNGKVAHSSGDSGANNEVDRGAGEQEATAESGELPTQLESSDAGDTEGIAHTEDDEEHGELEMPNAPDHDLEDDSGENAVDSEVTESSFHDETLDDANEGQIAVDKSDNAEYSLERDTKDSHMQEHIPDHAENKAELAGDDEESPYEAYDYGTGYVPSEVSDGTLEAADNELKVPLEAAKQAGGVDEGLESDLSDTSDSAETPEKNPADSTARTEDAEEAEFRFPEVDLEIAEDALSEAEEALERHRLEQAADEWEQDFDASAQDIAVEPADSAARTEEVEEAEFHFPEVDLEIAEDALSEAEEALERHRLEQAADEWEQDFDASVQDIVDEPADSAARTEEVEEAEFHFPEVDLEIAEDALSEAEEALERHRLEQAADEWEQDFDASVQDIAEEPGDSAASTEDVEEADFAELPFPEVDLEMAEDALSEAEDALERHQRDETELGSGPADSLENEGNQHVTY